MSKPPLDIAMEMEMLCPMGEDVAARGPHEELAADPRESVFELPPLERMPFADSVEKRLAVRRVIEQAERERAAAAAREARG
ncbi:hypothetical protein [Gaiella sp.]|uniref:hypothetical protein n=1 Tax=Gaiella sp. TaxID=2663207 RepID=UPI003983C9DE